MILPFTVDQAGYFFLIFVRIMTILALMPIFGAQAVPLQLKVALGLILTILLFSLAMEKALPVEGEFTLTL